MIQLLKRLWYGEPVIVLGFVNTIVVALGVRYEWAAIAALVTVPLLAWAARTQVEPIHAER